MEAINKIQGAPTGAVAAIQSGTSATTNATTRLVEPNAPSQVGQISQAEAFMGPRLAAQVKALPYFGGKVPEKVQYKHFFEAAYHDDGTIDADKILDKRNAFTCYYEAESKQTWADEAAVGAMQTALRASPETGLAGLVSDKVAARYAGWTMKIDKADKPKGAKYEDQYMDDKNGTLAKLGAMLRVRVIEGGIGRVVCKLPSSMIQGSSVVGRIEMNISLKSRTLAEVIAEAKSNPEALHNPLAQLKKLVPDLDLDSLAQRVTIDDIREQYIIVDPKGQDQFLVTLDHVTATNVNPDSANKGKKASFTEVEIERMDGSTAPTDIQQIIDLSNSLAQRWGMVASPGTKAQRGQMLTE